MPACRAPPPPVPCPSARIFVPILGVWWRHVHLLAIAQRHSSSKNIESSTFLNIRKSRSAPCAPPTSRLFSRRRAALAVPAAFSIRGRDHRSCSPSSTFSALLPNHVGCPFNFPRFLTHRIHQAHKHTQSLFLFLCLSHTQSHTHTYPYPTTTATGFSRAQREREKNRGVTLQNLFKNKNVLPVFRTWSDAAQCVASGAGPGRAVVVRTCAAA